MQSEVQKLFERYADIANRALGGDMDLDEAAALYASEYIGASPAGVRTGKSGEELKQFLAQTYAHFRAIGTKAMRLRNVRLSPIDACHCVAHVAWTATYARKAQPDVTVDFDVHYLVQQLDGPPQVFGWVSGDEQGLLRDKGII